ncbi:polysaccharide deacetylase family protein [Arenimonas terrae]|uniref:Polysaccharide deacetylase n=1 Tax=Arenimonas terrae TaxID=2546226 RepID=A0A5C4RVS6_9GAMM|nr:polysaccharide deacetylase family protein [Arenimonas terrae]TNJ35009.1 polysaccharide deacetylase [Arenimonas terrae]
MRLLFSCLLWLGSALPAVALSPVEPDRRIAITIDDLPWASLGDHQPHAPPAAMLEHHAQLLRGLREAGAPVVGFVNEAKLEVDGRLAPERLQMLRDWLQTGAELGNHTFGHTDLHAAGLAAYQADILKGERRLRPLLAESGAKPEWFRHPYLRAGRSPGDKAALAGFLAAHGYRIAPVTVDNSDWIWARAYRNVLDRGGDEQVLKRLRAEYVPYMLDKVDYYERFSIALLGYALPQTWLMHANEINAATYPALVAGVRARGYRTVSLAEAMRDPAYARDDAYTGAWGPSWLHRWAIGENRPREFFAGEPATPPWVLDLAGVEGE